MLAPNVRRLGEGGGLTTVPAGDKLSFSHYLFLRGYTPACAKPLVVRSFFFTIHFIMLLANQIHS
jgi:hypothetical protein